jgi:ATP-dependent Clp protease ATP-binding subunit ClpA
VDLEVSDAAKDRLAALGYDPTFGARPLKRVIQKHIVNLLSSRILDGEIVEGDVVRITPGSDGGLEFLVRKPAETHG